MNVVKLLLSVVPALYSGYSLGAARWLAYELPSGDLADSAGWEDVTLPGAEDNALIDGNGPYTASEDLNWGAFYYYAYGTVMDFTATPERRVTIHESDILVNFTGDERKLFLKGGVWGLDSVKDMKIFNGPRANNKLILSNSCQLVNADTLHINAQNGTNYPHDNELIIADKSVITALWTRLSSSMCYNNKLTIVSGGMLYPGGWFWMDNNDNASNNVVTVDGDGSKIVMSRGDFGLANRSCNNRLVVRNGGAVEAPNSTVKIGLVKQSSGNIARFESGASLSIKALTFGGNGNAFVFNGNTSTLSLPVSKTKPGTDFFGTGYGNLFSLENGASWSPDGILQLMQNSSNNVFRISGNAKFLNPDYEMTLGYQYPTNCVGNRIEVLDGAEMAVAKILVQGVDNGIVVSNATIQTSDIWSICLGYKYSTSPEYHSTNTFLCIQGKTPYVNLPGGNLRVTNGARLRFEIPEDGYPEDHVPVVCGWLTFDAGSRMEVECAGFAEKTGGKVKLMSVATSMVAPDGDLQKIADSCTGLPAGCSLVVKANEIWLKTPSRRGLKVLVK